MTGPTTRRQLLRRGGLGLAGTITLAGCTEEIGEEFPPNAKRPVSEHVPGLPVTEKTDVLEDEIKTFSDQEIDDVDTFVNAIEEYGVDVETTAEVLSVLKVEYVDGESYEKGTLKEIGTIAGAFAGLIEGGYETELLEITVLDAEHSPFGAAEIETELAARYVAGEVTAKEYGEFVAGTVESRASRPDVTADAE